jgi:predicted DNA-binding transcriptional regulator AlpA
MIAAIPASVDLSAYLDITEAAKHLGVRPGTVTRYRTWRIFPKPDVTLGRSPRWLPATLDRWQASRPGKGSGGGRPRKDKTAKEGEEPCAP